MSLQLSVTINGNQRCQIRFQHRHTFERVIDLLRVNKLIPASINKTQIKIVSGEGANAKAFKYDDYIINSVQSSEKEQPKIDIQFERSQISQDRSGQVNLENSLSVVRQDQQQQRIGKVQNIINIFLQRFKKKDFANIKKYHDAKEQVVRNVADIAKHAERDYAICLFYKEYVTKLTEAQEKACKDYKSLFKQQYMRVVGECQKKTQISDVSSQNGFMKKSVPFQQKSSQESYQNMISELKRNLQGKQRKCSELQIENIELKKKQIEQVNKLSLLMTQQYETKIVQVKQRQQKAMKQQIKKFEEKIKALQKQVKTTTSEKKNDEEIIKKLEKEKASLTQTNRKQKIQNEELQEQILANRKREALIEQLQQEQKQIKQNLKKIQYQKRQVQAQLHKCRRQYEFQRIAFTQELDKAKIQAEQAKDAIEKLKKNHHNSQLQQKIINAEDNLNFSGLSVEELAIKIGQDPRKVIKHISQFIKAKFQLKIVFDFNPSERHSSSKLAERLLECSNILIFCKSIEGDIIGGFVTLPRNSMYDESPSVKQKPQKKKAFLFNSNSTQGKITIYNLRQGKEAIIHDEDFLTFGDEELCLDYSTAQLSRRSATNVKAERFCYQIAINRRNNLLNSQGDDEIQLESYLILTCDQQKQL